MDIDGCQLCGEQDPRSFPAGPAPTEAIKRIRALAEDVDVWCDNPDPLKLLDDVDQVLAWIDGGVEGEA